MKREVAGGRSQDELTEEHTSADAIAAKYSTVHYMYITV